MRAGISISIVSACVLSLLAGAARAQYNPDGTPSMIPANGDVFDAGVSPAAAPSASNTGTIYQEGGDGLPTEDFSVDCDPDIESCIDPSADSPYDDGYDPMAYQQFQAALSPYGQWLDDPDYGEVWTPSPDVVGGDFEPYATDGQWEASSDYGMVWVSDYEWGWAPFHYGRWVLGAWGWMWVPGSLWGPAWVDWRYGNGYCGWAPMPPRGVHQAVPRGGSPQHDPWHFTLASEVMRRNPTYIPSKVVPGIFKRTVAVRNARPVTINGVTTKIALGPSPTQLAHDLGRTVPALALRNSAPSVLPRQSIVAKAGIALPKRPYVQHAAYAGSVRSMVQGRISPMHEPVRAYNNDSYVAPSRGAYTNTNSAIPPLRSSYNNQNYPGDAAYRTSAQPIAHSEPVRPTYQQPVYQQPVYQQPAPQQTWHSEPVHPSYVQPAQPTYTQAAPVYHEQPVYHQQPMRSEAPVYRAAPEPVRAPVAAPMQHAAPSFSAPFVHRR